MLQDSFGLSSGNHGRERGDVGMSNRLQAAEVLEKAARGALAHARNFTEFSRAIANLAALAMKRNGEAVSFIADQLHQVQDGIVVIEGYGLIFLPADINDF